MITGADIVAEARTWLGTPYQHLARDKGRHTDCVGLIIGIARRFGLGDYRNRDYGRIPDPEKMTAELERHLDPISRANARPGDILWFALRDPATRKSLPRHVAILADYYLGGPSIIHAYAEAGKVVEHRFDAKWERRVCGAFRYRGVID